MLNTMKNTHQKINRVIYFWTMILIMAGSFACTQKVEKEAKAPPDLIPRDTLVNIFVDLRLMDAVVNFEQKRGNRDVNDINYYLHNSILEKYGITREQFERSFSYYQTDLDVLDGIYADAITQLSKLKSQMEQE